jgi:thioredoxin 1
VLIYKLIKKLVLISIIGFALLIMSSCGAASDKDTSVAPPGGGDSRPATTSEISVLTEVDLDYILSQGLPVLLYFGDNSQASQDTLAILNKISGECGGDILIFTVDLAQYPEAREGFPVQVVPSQFFYMSDGQPITLPMNIGVILSTFLSVDTEEPVFTMHEGALSEEELVNILTFMGVM